MGVVAVFAILVLALGVTVAQEDNVLYVNWGEGDIPSLDPSYGTDTSSIQIVVETLPGLTRINELTAATEPGMATSWDVSDDGLTYTFHILEGVSWVKYNADSGEVEQVMDADGNARMVTAADFQFGMMRSMDPRIGEFYGGILSGWVVGGSEYYNALAALPEGASEDEINAAAEAAAANVQVAVVDDYTVQVTSPRPAAFISSIYGMWMATAQPSWAVEEFGNQWTEDANFVSYGPFALKEWKHDESLTLVRNPFWAGTEFIPAASLDAIVGTMIATEGALANYEAGTLDITGVPSADLERVKADAVLSQEYVTGPGTCTYAYVFNTAVAPFDDVRIRRAFSMAVNRQDLIDNVTKAGQSPALFWTYPGIAGSPLQADYADLALAENDDLARELVDEYVAENGPLPTITLMHNQSSGHAAIAAAVVGMWAETLGIDNIEISSQEWATYLETTKNNDTAPAIFRYAWCYDYPDAHNFIFDVFHSSVMELGTSWYNPEFDQLLEDALVETDPQTRTDLYAEAEYILTNGDAVVVPIYYYTSSRLTKPYVDRTYSIIGQNYFEFWSLNR
jgi:oligopeptide transport system substrate-binding protein